MRWRLFLDDERIPKTNDKDHPWVIARSVEQAKTLIEKNGCPFEISFDNDLGVAEMEKEGYGFAKWLVDSDLSGAVEIPSDFRFNVHSANPSAKRNIQLLLDRYLKHKRDGN